jgi:hypothetical protein
VLDSRQETCPGTAITVFSIRTVWHAPLYIYVSATNFTLWVPLNCSLSYYILNTILYKNYDAITDTIRVPQSNAEVLHKSNDNNHAPFHSFSAIYNKNSIKTALTKQESQVSMASDIVTSQTCRAWVRWTRTYHINKTAHDSQSHRAICTKSTQHFPLL